jgi:hypothetical protein
MPPKTIEIELDSRPKAPPADRIPAVDKGSEPASHRGMVFLFGILGLAVIGIAIWGAASFGSRCRMWLLRAEGLRDGKSRWPRKRSSGA